MTSKKQNSKEKEKRKLSWWGLALIIIAVLFILDFFDNDDYEYCVDECASELSYCLGSSTEYSGTIEYILDYEAEYCSYDLEDCVRDCKT
ncbi:hypothetical protein KAJ38_02370 [Candidatus Pacearchaeota archaeon]|nr:hypothetical protein [Candidatus Pacearchaeota archaeon]